MKTALIIILGILFLGAICKSPQVNNNIPTPTVNIDAIASLTPTQEAAPTPTVTPEPTPTSIPAPTWTPRPPLPTATQRPPEPTPAPQRWIEIPAIGWSGTITYDAAAYGDEYPLGQYGGFTWLGYKDPNGILMMSFHNPPHSRLMGIQQGMTLVVNWYEQKYRFTLVRYHLILWTEAFPSIKSYLIFCDTSTPQGDVRAWEIERI